MTGKLAIVGDGDGITVFKAAGVAAFKASDAKEAKKILRSVAKDYSFIFLSESLAKELEEFLKIFEEQPYPVISVVPTDGGDYGRQKLKSAMERALGVDILFGE